MKRKITFLSAAFMLLAFLAIPLGMRGQTTVTQTSFSAISGNVNDDTNVSYAAYKGGGTSNPAVNSNAIRLYQNSSGATGGYVVIGVGNGYEITSATIQSTMATTTGYLLTDSDPENNTPAKSTFDVSDYSLSANTDYTVDGISTQYITFACFGTSTSTRLYLSKISITYQTTGGTPAVTHTLTFSANPTDGGTVTVGNTTLAEGATTSISATANTGYVFDSWTVEGEESSVDNEDAPSTTFTMGTEDATLTANFTTVTTYTVTYHANVAGIDDIEMVYNEGEDVTVAANTFSNSGFDFSEWNTQADGDGDPYVAGDVIENINADIDLYAQWTEATPSTGGNVTFDATVDKDEDGDLTIVKDGVTFSCSSGALGNGTEYRIYKNATATFSVTSGTITNIEFTCTSSNPASGFATMAGFTTNGNNGTWSGSAESVTFTASNKQVRATQIVVTVNNGGTPAPSITIENNDEIAYDATSGSFTFTVNNLVDGGETTVAEDVDWISNAAVSENTVTFTTTQNDVAAARSGIITLTYTYGDSQTVTKDVTVIQDGNPNAFDNISDITDAGNYRVKGMVIATSSKGFIIGDGTGYVYTYMGNTSFDYAVGDNLSISGTTSTNYGHVIQFTNAATIEEVEETNYNGEPQPTAITEVPDYSEGNHLSTYLQFEGQLTKSGNYYLVALGEGQIRISYPTDDQAAELDPLENKTVRVHGFFTGISTSNNTSVFTVMMESVEEVVALTITLNTSVSVPAEGGLDIITVEYVNIDNTYYPELLYYNENQEQVEASDYDWITLNFNDDDNVQYNCDANTTVETRSIYFKVLAHDYDNNEVTSDLVTITQDAYVAPIASIIVNPDLVEALAEGEDGTLTVTYENIIEIVADVYFCDANGEAANYDWIDAEIDNDNNVYYIINTNDGEARTAYFKVFAINGEEFVYSNLVTVTQNAPVAPVAEGWVLTDLADLTSNDVFVIVGTDFSGNMFAMSNDNGTTTAPAAVGVTVVDDMLENAPEANIQWNLSIADNGYTFYPNGNTESWLYCTTTSGSGNNNNMRVGDGSRNVFTFNNDGYMITNDDYATRYMSVYNNQEWRGYVNTNNNPVAISFYKKVGDEPQPVVASITVNPALVEATAAETEGTLTVTYVNIADVEDEIYFCDANGEAATYDWITADYDTDNNVYYFIEANTGEARTAYFMVHGVDADANDVYSNLVTINQDAYVAPAETWVLTNLADLTEGDVFVIVGTRYDDNYAGNYAMPNDNDNSAPGAVAITINGEALAEEPAANLQWNISRTGNSYTFYPNGDTENWLYCTNANNGVKVGVGSAHHFTLSDNGYLTTTETTVQRYLGIYNSQDWRCYTSEGGNIANQTFAFYKKNVSTQTYNLTINGYGQSEGGYRLIASPVYVNPENTGMITDDGTDPENYTYDFYFFDQAQEDEWRNYRQEAFNLIPGKGYLYASQESTTLTFTGTPYSGDGSVSLVKDNNAVWSGWNLVGNPFGETAYIDRDFYVMNEAGTEILTDACTGAVEAMQGVFVIAEEDGEPLTFTTEAPEAAANVTLNLSQNRGAVIDRAIVRFNEGRQLPKFQLNAESTKLYIPQGSNDYAVVSSAAYGEMPVNFKAQNNGTYTISVNTENAETNYLHLIDNMTGADIDLLQTPSYTFEAKTTDYASRFRLVFNVTGIEENTTSTEPFAFFNGSEWVINNTGEATLQMVDLTGRILSSESISGNATVSTANLSTGIYMMRLVNGENVKTQKVVIK